MKARLTPSVLAMATILVGFIAFCVSRGDFVPIWDGAWYVDFVEAAINQPFSFENYSTGHFAPTFYLEHGAFLKLWASSWSVHFASCVFALAAIPCFFRFLRWQFPNKDLTVELLLLTVLLAFSPLFLATLFNLTPDHTTMCLLIVYLAVLPGRRPWAIFLTGLLLTFSKEVGAAMTLYAGSLFFIIHVLRPGLAGGSRRNHIHLAIAILAPLVCYAAYIGGYAIPHRKSHAFAWDGLGKEMQVSVWEIVLGGSFTDPVVRSYLADVFVLSFSWLLTLPMIAVTVQAALRWARGLSLPDHGVIEKNIRMFNFLLLIGALYATTRYRHWNNPRYLLCCYPALLLAGYSALTTLVRQRRIRQAYLALCCVLFGASIFRTIDPLSKLAFGTFAFGDHQLLNMESMRGIASIGDELVYNLEYQQVHYLFNGTLQHLHEPQKTVIFAPATACFHFPGRVDSASQERTLATANTYLPQMYCHDYHELDVVAEQKLPAIYIEFPNKPDPSYLAYVRSRLHETSREEIAIDGYKLTVSHF